MNLNSKLLNILFTSDKRCKIHFQASSINGFKFSILSSISSTLHYSMSVDKKNQIIPE